MKFTFVTSFYNTAEYIHPIYECIKSQTYTNWEWIVTEDFSSDNSREILLDIASKDKKVTFKQQTEKKQMFWNPHSLAPNAEIIVELGSDDLLSPKTLEVYHHFFTKYPDVIMISSGAVSYNVDGGWNCFEFFDISEDKNMLSSGKTLFLKAWRNIEDFNYNPGWWMENHYNDLAFCTQLEEYGKILVLPRYLYDYTYRDNSASRFTRNKIETVKKEGASIITNANLRRNYQELETFEKYFEDVREFVSPMLEREFAYTNTQQHINYFTSVITKEQEKKIKDLFFDHDVYINKITDNVDWVFMYGRTWSDFEMIKHTLPKIMGIPNIKVRISINRLYEGTEHTLEEFKSFESWLAKEYGYDNVCYHYCLYTLSQKI